jgi:hypothetical protein
LVIGSTDGGSSGSLNEGEPDVASAVVPEPIPDEVVPGGVVPGEVDGLPEVLSDEDEGTPESDRTRLVSFCDAPAIVSPTTGILSFANSPTVDTVSCTRGFNHKFPACDLRRS